jgi:hypothetical protein
MPHDTDDAINQALDGNPRAEELAEMVAALEVRRSTFERELESASGDADRKEWTQRIREVNKQIAILKQEMAITDFVEKSVKVAANRPNFDIEDDGYD